MKKIGPKPKICSSCHWESKNPKQIELHHLIDVDVDYGRKHARNKIYYSTKKLQPICANCHSLEHRTGEKLQQKCGIWHKKLPGNQKYKNPNDIFTYDCVETWGIALRAIDRVQKNYYLK
uniref:Putative LAGLIDADG homing endonuclease n=2 Tax=Ignatiaceae TaxID=2682551 RepID=A0A1W6EGV7_9CHLO|nr:putative LAGLIDADG homing endonuclease [Pseudocharacium americanum]YP_009367743.1 putative LAGLIDADG homing endonuclease [Ignatius tetrasporus]ARK14629.1 putative LAGLIDADG homing endonuclease [Pseudocharacium americanum]ARK14718.1 putative LAGLIDADG homing endonuclease [Ignatius tetrasporus]